jgi:hypothetical protein
VWRDPLNGTAGELPEACIVTLTYAPEHLPVSGLLVHDDFSAFMKRLRQRRVRRYRRKKLGPTPKVATFMCGEYGGKTLRPHFHAVLLGETFDDRYPLQLSDGQRHQGSHQLDELWPWGLSTVDEFSFAGAGYVAGYVAKKRGDPVEKLDPATGEVVPEYRTMSRGLGRSWILGEDRGGVPRFPEVYGQDCVTVGEWKFRPPRYYDRLLLRHDEALFVDVKQRRLERALQGFEDWSEPEARSAEKVAHASLSRRSDSL